MIRGIVKSVVGGVIQRLSATIWGDGSIEDREFFQHYGYTSRPKAGAEVILLRNGNSIIAIASDDRRYRIELEEGEAAIYDDQGQVVHLTRTGIEITSAAKVTITAPEVLLDAGTKVTIDSPLLEVTGDINAGGNVSDSKGSMDEMRSTYNTHTQVVSNGVAQAPAQAMT